jgi:hypothetical protein
MRPLAYVIAALMGVLGFVVLKLTGSILCIIGTLVLLFGIWCLICAASPKCREPNQKFPNGDTIKGCLSWAISAAIIGAVIFAIGLKFQI